MIINICWGAEDNGGASSPEVPDMSPLLQHAADQATQISNYYGNALDTGITEHFSRITHILFPDVRCATDPLTSRMSIGFADCKARCMLEPDDRCRFLAYWQKTKFCETYETCEPQTNLDKRGKKLEGLGVSVYKRSSECEVLADHEGTGVYPTLMSEAFPENIMRLEENQNTWCRCISARWMVCGIFAKPGSIEDT